jgi:hypothetical protein
LNKTQQQEMVRLFPRWGFRVKFLSRIRKRIIVRYPQSKGGGEILGKQYPRGICLGAYSAYFSLVDFCTSSLWRHRGCEAQIPDWRLSIADVGEIVVCPSRLVSLSVGT